MEKKLDRNYKRMRWAILNKSWRQHPTKQQLYGHVPPITKTIKVRRTRHAGHCCWSRDELTRDVLLWTPLHGRAKAGRPARTYIQLLCADTGCSPEDLPEAMDDTEWWEERARDIRANGVTCWCFLCWSVGFFGKFLFKWMAMSVLLNCWLAASFSVGVSCFFWCLRLKRFSVPSTFCKSRSFGWIVILPLFCRSCIWLCNISISFFFLILRSHFLRCGNFGLS